MSVKMGPGPTFSPKVSKLLDLISDFSRWVFCAICSLLLLRNSSFSWPGILGFLCTNPILVILHLAFVLAEFLAELFENTGFKSSTNDYVLRETVNKKEGLCVPRVFLQSKFTKNIQSQTSDTS